MIASCVHAPFVAPTPHTPCFAVPENYKVVKRTHRGPPWGGPNGNDIVDGDEYYFTEKQTHISLPTNFGWRLMMLPLNIYWTWKTGVQSWIWLLWKGPLSLQAFFRCNEFKTHRDVNIHTGEGGEGGEKPFPPPTGPATPPIPPPAPGVMEWQGAPTYSFAVRLRALWQSISDARTAFEEAPEGLIGKTVTRILVGSGR